MKIKTYVLMVLAACIALTLNAQTFKSGKLYYEVVDAGNRLAQVTAGPEAYTDVVTADFATTVTNEGIEYTVVGIGVQAFVNATIRSLCYLPEGYLYIDNSAFAGAVGTAAGIQVPASMTYISPTAFESNSIGFILANADNPYFAHLSCTQDGAKFNYFCNKEKTKIIAVPGQKLKNVTGSTMNYISNLVIPEQITEIGDYAFCGNPNLKSVTLHKGITKYGEGAFYDCDNLPSITLPNPNAEYGSSMFGVCASLTNVKLPAGIKSLPTGMFYCCTALSSITLPEGLEEIHRSCFASTALTSINLPSTLWLLDTCALQNTKITAIDLKNVKVIGNMAFVGCSNLSSITGGEKVEEIQNATFTNCPLLTAAPYFPSLKRMLGVPYFLCSFVDFTVPASTEYIDNNPIACCQSVQEIMVEEGSTHFAAMDSCLYELKDGKPYRLVSCPTARFNTELVLQPGTEVLGKQAIREVPLTGLYGNAELKEINVGGARPSITTVRMLAPVPPTGGTDFAEETYANGTLYVPKSSLKAYKSAEGWRNFQNIVGIDVTEPGIKGDINGDGVVDVADLNALINVVLGNSEVDTAKGDLNGDTIIDIVDINLLINIILN